MIMVGEKVRRRNGGFLEFLSLLLVYEIVSRFIQIKRTEGVLFLVEAERAIGTIVSMINIVMMLIAMCVCITIRKNTMKSTTCAR